MTHEQTYVDAIVAEASKHGTVESITVEVGELAPIPAAELAAALKFTGWGITMATRRGTVRCACGYLGPPVITDKGHDYTFFHCPECEAQLPPIIDGKDVVLKDVTVKE